jgi:hypothetical protein
VKFESLLSLFFTLENESDIPLVVALVNLDSHLSIWELHANLLNRFDIVDGLWELERLLFENFSLGWVFISICAFLILLFETRITNVLD